MKCDAKAYILWGGQYDVRELELIEFTTGKGSQFSPGVQAFFYEDNTGGHMSFTSDSRTTKEEAKIALCKLVFSIGEDGSYIDFGDAGIVRW